MADKLKIKGDIPPEHIDEILRLHSNNNFAQLLGVNILGLGKGHCRMSLFIDEKCANPYGGLHGGVTATLADMAMGIVLRTLGLQPVTAELTVNYLGPAQIGEEIVAEAQLVHRGSKLILTNCMVTTTKGKSIASGRGLFMTRGHLGS